MRATRRLVATGALSALALAGIPSAGAQTPTVTEVIGAADGLFVDVDVADVPVPAAPLGQGDVGALATLTFGPEPSVVLPPEGGSVSEEVLDLDESVAGVIGVGVTASVLRTSAEGALGPDGFATAETTVADLTLTEEVLGPIAQQVGDFITAEAVTATCSADLDGVTGSTTLVNATVLGETLEAEPEPNTEITILDPETTGATVTLNQQVENPDGSLSVTALVIDVVVEEVFTATVQVGPATCGVVEGLLPVEVPAEEVTPAQPVPAQVTFTG